MALSDRNITGFTRPSSFNALIGGVSPFVPSLSDAATTAGADIFACACLTVPFASTRMAVPRTLLVESTPGFSVLAASANNFNFSVIGTTLTTTSGSPTATVASAANLTVGMTITSVDPITDVLQVPTGTKIYSISGTTITMTLNALTTDAQAASFLELVSNGFMPYTPFGGNTRLIFSTSGSPTVTVNSAANLLPGMVVRSANIPASTVVLAVSGTTVTLSANATGTTTKPSGDGAQFDGANGDYGGVMSSLGTATGDSSVPFPGVCQTSQGIFAAAKLPQGFQRFTTLQSVVAVPRAALQTLYPNQLICIRSWAFPFAETDRTGWKFRVNWVWDEALV